MIVRLHGGHVACTTRSKAGLPTGTEIRNVATTISVPVRLLSTTALTNMAFTVVYPAERFTNFTLTVNSPEVLTQRLRLLSPGELEVAFTLPAASVLHGPTTVGELGFTALPDQPSGFVSLPILDVAGCQPDGEMAGNAYGLPGRVVVIGPEPLLEAWLDTNRQPMLTLYGNPGHGHMLEWKTNVFDAFWQSGPSVLLTNLWQDFEVPKNAPSLFYRAYRQ